MCDWTLQRKESSCEFSEQTVQSILRTFRDGFGIPGWSEEGVRRRLMKSDIACFLLGVDKTVYGYALYFIPSMPLNGRFLLWENSIALAKNVQGKGFSSQILRRVLKAYPEKEFGWVGGRTQNPLIFKHYSALGGTLFPFDESYTSEEGRKLLNYLIQNIPEVSSVDQKDQLEKDHGICKRIYKEGRLGDYDDRISGTSCFERKLKAWGFNRNDGDAVVLINRLREKV